jgi:hypothetical protein
MKTYLTLKCLIQQIDLETILLLTPVLANTNSDCSIRTRAMRAERSTLWSIEEAAHWRGVLTLYQEFLREPFGHTTILSEHTEVMFAVIQSNYAHMYSSVLLAYCLQPIGSLSEEIMLSTNSASTSNRLTSSVSHFAFLSPLILLASSD